MAAKAPGFYSDTGGASVEHRIPIDKTMYFTGEEDNGDSGSGSVTIDWTVNNKQKITLTGSPTLVFTDPAGPSNFIFRIIQDAIGSRTITWPSNIKWANGTPPALSSGGQEIDILGIYFDGTDYYGNLSPNFS